MRLERTTRATDAERGEPWFTTPRPAGRPGLFTFHVNLEGAPAAAMQTLVAQLERCGCRLEWFTAELLRVDAARAPLARQVLALLLHVEALGYLSFEARRSA